MVDIIIATHGSLAEGLKDAVNLVAGEQDRLQCIGLRHEDSIEEFTEKIRVMAERSENDVLFLTDLLGASPYNAAAQAISQIGEKKIACVSGVNLAMVIEAVFQRETEDVYDLAEKLVESGNQGIAKLTLEL